jgi:fumarate reductase subunit D
MAEEIRSARESVSWSPGRDAVHADAEAPPEVLFEPVFWGLFSLGGFVTAFLFPVTLFLLFFAAPFGLWPFDPGGHDAFAARWAEPLVRLFFVLLIGGSLFHGTHRLKYLLVDAGLRGPWAQGVLDLVLNGIAVVGTLVALYYAARGWFF